MKKTYTFLALALVAIVISMFTCTGAKTHAQQPKANAAPIPTPTPEVKLPPVVALTAEESTKVIDATKDATITDLQAQNLKLQIEKAQLQLKELNDSTQKKIEARTAVWQAALEKAGVPKDKIDQYESVDPLPGSNIITFKLKATPKN